MTDKIEPALTPKQWDLRAIKSGGNDWLGFRLEGPSDDQLRLEFDVSSGRASDQEITSDEVPSTMIPGVIALANAALPDADPRKITREKIDTLRRLAGRAPENWATFYGDEGGILFLDALESYLPPADD